MSSGDEIGIFNGDLCVGAGVYDGEFPMVIAAWEDEIMTPEVLDGYTYGNEMTFILFDRSENSEIIFEEPPQIQGIVDDPIAPTHS